MFRIYVHHMKQAIKRRKDDSLRNHFKELIKKDSLTLKYK